MHGTKKQAIGETAIITARINIGDITTYISLALTLETRSNVAAVHQYTIQSPALDTDKVAIG